MDPSLIRNFSIIAHIDHGKSTLADRLLEMTEALSHREMKQQVLDTMDIERERGITIKAQAVRINYLAKDSKTYQLNLIDTPGHVDFSYEVSRSLAACEGALLVVDAAQGVEAQTLANTYLALDHELEIIPIINKIDLPAADPGRVREEIESTIGLDATDALLVSAKSGQGVAEILEAIVSRIPPPKGSETGPLRALLFDSWFDPYRGVVILARVLDGSLRKGMKIRLWSTGRAYTVEELGYRTPKTFPCEELASGEVGWVVANIKDVTETKIGDTICDDADPAAEPLEGFEESKPMVFAGLYPVESHEHQLLREALEKLQLNDRSFQFEPESSTALGFGFRCGFLGLLHLEIVQERLEREFGLNLITTAPSVRYRVSKAGGEVVEVDNPSHWPAIQDIKKIEEPIFLVTVITPDEHLGGILKLLDDKRGRAEGLRVRCGQPRDADVRSSPQRDRAGFLRPPQDGLPRLCVGRLPLLGIPRVADGQAGCADSRRSDRCALSDRVSGAGARPGQSLDRKDAQAHPPPNVRSRLASRDRQQGRGQGDHRAIAQERYREVLRRRYFAQAQAARKAKGGEETHEARGARGYPARGLPRGLAGIEMISGGLLEKTSDGRTEAWTEVHAPGAARYAPRRPGGRRGPAESRSYHEPGC